MAIKAASFLNFSKFIHKSTETMLSREQLSKMGWGRRMGTVYEKIDVYFIAVN